MDETTFEPEEIDLRAYWETLKKRRLTILVSLVAVVALASLFTFTQKPKYQASARILAKGHDRSSGGDILSSTIPALGAFADQRDVQTQVEIIRAWPLLKEAAQRTGLEVADPRQVPVKVEGGKDSNVISVTTTSTDPREAMTLANNVASVFVERNLEQNRSSARAGRLFLEDQRVKIREDLENAARALRDYQERTGAVGLDAATEKMVGALADLEATRTAAESERQAAAARVEQLRDEMGHTSETITASTSIARNPGIQKMQDEIADLQVERAGLLKDYAATSSKVLAVDARIRTAQNREKELVAEILAGKQIAVNPVRQTLITGLIAAEGDTLAARARMSGLDRAIARHQEDLRALPEREYRLAQLSRNVQIAEKTYLAVQDRYQQLRIAEESTLANAQVIEPALEPTHPVSPKVKLNLVLAVLVGLMLGVGLAALQEALDDSVSTGEDVERELALPVLGVIGRITEPEERSILRAGNFSGVSETFRMIRSNVKFMAVDKPLRTIMVTSASKGEGKSTTAANLAVALAQDGRKVVLMDCDLRRPSVHKQFGIPNTVGLTNAIVAGTPLVEVEHDVEVENLRVITAGPIPPNPAELLDSARFARLVEEMRTENDIIVCDAPPVLGVADASVLGGRVDGVVMVIASGEVDRGAARRTVQMLQQARATVLGVVLNKMRHRGSGYYDYYYSNYYHYSEDAGNGRGHGRLGRRRAGALTRRGRD